MPSFNFITDEGLRGSLESDFAELGRCAEEGAWKATHVLAGSLIEAILIDSLIATGVVTHDAGMKLDLGAAVDKSRESKLVRPTTADLCSAVRQYRNLIHPGRSLRLQEAVNKETAGVVAGLVNIITAEVAKKRLENYGYTAEQIIAKIIADSSVQAILPHILKETKVPEVERLLFKLLPASYVDAWTDPETPAYLLAAFVSCYRTALNQGDASLKAKAARHFVKMIKEDTGQALMSHGTAFFRAIDLRHLQPADRAVVLDHLLSRCKTEISKELLRALSGIGAYLQGERVAQFVDPLIRTATSNSPFRVAAKEALEAGFFYTTGDTDAKIASRLAQWEKNYRDSGKTDRASIVEEIRNHFEDLLKTPF